jgi:molybdopterin-guanine dinucleotide biosynthesis protein A
MTIDREAIGIGVLAGGDSRRMGSDKALLTVGGHTLLERAVRTALVVTPLVAVSGREAPAGWPLPAIPFLPDLVPGRGPLHGIVRLLQHFDRPVLAIGCDMPLITGTALTWLTERYRERSGSVTGADDEEGLAVMDDAGVIQPLFSIYTLATLARVPADTRNPGPDAITSARYLIETGRFGRVTIPEHLGEALLSVDTPADLDRLRSGSPLNPGTPAI